MIHRSAEEITRDGNTTASIWVSCQTCIWCWNVFTHLFSLFFFLNLPCQSPPLPDFHPQPRNELNVLGQQSLNGGVHIPSRSDERLQVGFAVDEAHGVELVELLLETNLWGLKLWRKRRRVRSDMAYWQRWTIVFRFWLQALFSERRYSTKCFFILLPADFDAFAFSNIIKTDIQHSRF